MGSLGLADVAAPEAAGLAVTDPAPGAGSEASSAHRAFAVAAFNGAWELIDLPARTPQQQRQMLMLAFASRWHWGEVGTDENVVVSDWQVGHVAALAGEVGLARQFSEAAYDLARSAGLPDWLRASTAEGMARAYAVAGDRDGYERYAEEARTLVAALDNDEDRELITGQLASIPTT
jgi:hypothetical protein